MPNPPWRSRFMQRAIEAGHVAETMAAKVADGYAWDSVEVEEIARGTIVERMADVSGLTVGAYARELLDAAGHASPSSASGSSTSGSGP